MIDKITTNKSKNTNGFRMYKRQHGIQKDKTQKKTKRKILIKFKLVKKTRKM